MNPILAPLSLALLAALAAAQTPTVSAAGENMRLRSHSVSGSAPAFNIDATVDHDNGNSGLPTSWRRWWHFEVGNLDPSAVTTLNVRILSAGYSDVILPVWSQSTDGGQNFGRFRRVPTSATPTVSGSTHRFTLQVPAGVTDIRLAKYFPYTVSQKDAWQASIAGHPRVRSVKFLGSSRQGRPIEMIEITDSSVPDSSKHRVWIHAAVHPSETTSYFTVEGLVGFLLSGSPASELLLDHLIVDVVPMTNPDGVFLGNYRTNSRSVNLENQWTAPYNSTEREIVALRTQIEALMGTPASPGNNPIEVLLNLHSSHNVAFPFHFEHVANASFNLVSNRTGVIPSVNAKEKKWIAAFVNQSPLVARGSTMSSTLGAPTRPFVESMMHDRWSIDPLWTGSPNFEQEVMAITFEGTYGRGPDAIAWNTDDDYRDVGEQMGIALGEYFGLLPGGTISPYGTSCSGPILFGNLVLNPARVDLTMVNGLPLAPLWLVIGVSETTVPLPPPSACPLRTELAIVVGGMANSGGAYNLSIPLPNIAGLSVKLQVVLADVQPTFVFWTSSNGLSLQYVR